MTQPEPTDSIVLELDRSRTPRAFKATEALWKGEWEQICRLLREHAKVRKPHKPTGASGRSSVSDPPNLAIAIFGSHGSGKSSLLATLAAASGGEEAELKALKEGFPPHVSSLPIIRPNQLAPEESFLYAFLAAASEEEQRKRPKDESSRRDSSFLSAFQQEFQKVSEYLRVIDHDRGVQEYDALGVSLERLERHASDVRLREALGELIRALANSLTGSDEGLVLLPVDDADMSQSHLSNSLDTYMRYLYHPQLVPIFTFTGRQSEELMKAHFSGRLSGAEGGGAVNVRRSGEFEEKIALHYLARIFPVRNRIRLGASTVQIQKAKYRVTGDDETPDAGGRSVFALLVRASRLLFGEAEGRAEPQVRLALRPGELRKQLQILDVLQSERIDDLPEGASLASVASFEKAAWSVLDSHRETLRQVGLHLDELFGYPSRGLRELILGTLLERPLDERRRNLERWRHQTEDQGSQILSLLALNAFRPALRAREVVPGQVPKDLSPSDPSEFDFYDIGYPTAGGKAALSKGGGQGEPPAKVEEISPSSKALGPDIVLVWFMTLWCGFYLPQILARERHLVPKSRRSDADADEPRDAAALGVGWHVPRASALACGEALANRERRQTGMFLLSRTEANPFLGHHKEDDLLAVAGRDPFALLLALWCFHGYEGGEPWLLVSLWRGLSLLSQLLELRPFLDLKVKETRDKAANADDEEAWEGLNAEADALQIEIIKNILKDHVKTSRYYGSLKLRRSKNPWPAVLPSAAAADPAAEELFADLAGKIHDWLWLGEQTAGDGPGDFVRSLHGDQLLGNLWPRLDAVYDDFKPKPPRREEFDPEKNLGFRSGLRAWFRVLEEYWETSGCVSVLRTCPFIEPLFAQKVPPGAEPEPVSFLDMELTQEYDVAATGAPAPGEKGKKNASCCKAAAGDENDPTSEASTP